MSAMQDKIRAAKKQLLKMHYTRKVGHLGGNLSSLDALMVLHHEVMTAEDHFILSKGHAAGALYVTLWSIGRLSSADLDTFHADGTHLAGHPMSGWLPDIPIATGSLGHGFPVALGLALGQQLRNIAGHIYCLTSDGEWQEGSNWEALIFFAHHQFSNVTLLIDRNRLQGFGTTQEIASMDDLPQKIAAFGLAVKEVEGHDPAAIHAALHDKKIKVVILNTIKGNGISFMENKMEWHYLPLSDAQYQQACLEVHAS